MLTDIVPNSHVSMRSSSTCSSRQLPITTCRAPLTVDRKRPGSWREIEQRVAEYAKGRLDLMRRRHRRQVFKLESISPTRCSFARWRSAGPWTARWLRQFRPPYPHLKRRKLSAPRKQLHRRSHSSGQITARTQARCSPAASTRPSARRRVEAERLRIPARHCRRRSG